MNYWQEELPDNQTLYFVQSGDVIEYVLAVGKPTGLGTFKEKINSLLATSIKRHGGKGKPKYRGVIEAL